MADFCKKYNKSKYLKLKYQYGGSCVIDSSKCGKVYSHWSEEKKIVA